MKFPCHIQAKQKLYEWNYIYLNVTIALKRFKNGISSLPMNGIKLKSLWATYLKKNLKHFHDYIEAMKMEWNK